MQIVIDIPEDTHERLTRPDRLFTDDDINKVCWAVHNGTVLPKHGRLIDADAQDLQAELWTFTRYTGIDEMPYEDATQAIDNTPTILEADMVEP